MPEPKYVRPNIERARLVNPEREPGNRTEAEDQPRVLAEERTILTRKAFSLLNYQYDAPFSYPNFRVEVGRPWENSSNHVNPDAPEDKWAKLTEDVMAGYVGAEFNPDGVELDVPPYGSITFQEDEPIVEVTVIGSACAPPGYVLLFGEPVEWKYWRTGVKMRVDNLWGEHLRWHLWSKGFDEGYRDAGHELRGFSHPAVQEDHHHGR